MALSLNIQDLVKTDESLRDSDWELAFFHALLDSKLKLINEAPQVGPDNWPYMLAEVSNEGTEAVPQMLHWLSDKGIGLAINPQKPVPDYVFTYGMVWNFRERQQFLTPVADEPRVGQIKFEAGEKVLVGAPTAEYLPEYVKTVLREFFRQQKINNMKIVVMARGSSNKQYDLCFSLDAMGLPNKSEHHGILEALSWFLPAHYSLMLIGEKDMPQFQAL